jgi:hypothetical protein
MVLKEGSPGLRRRSWDRGQDPRSAVCLVFHPGSTAVPNTRGSADAASAQSCLDERQTAPGASPSRAAQVISKTSGPAASVADVFVCAYKSPTIGAVPDSPEPRLGGRCRVAE